MNITGITSFNNLACTALTNSGVSIFPPIVPSSPMLGVDSTGQSVCLVSRSHHMGPVLEGVMATGAIRKLIAIPSVMKKLTAYAVFSKAAKFPGVPAIAALSALISESDFDILEYVRADVLVVMEGSEFSVKATAGVGKVTMQGQFIRNDASRPLPYLLVSTKRLPGTAVLTTVSGVGLYVQVWNSVLSFKRGTFVDLCGKFGK